MVLPNGKAIKGHGTHRVDSQLPEEDWGVPFKLLEEGQIKPLIAARFPILEAAKADILLESGQAAGNVVLLAPELLWIQRICDDSMPEAYFTSSDGSRLCELCLNSARRRTALK